MAQNNIRVKVISKAGHKTVVGKTSFLKQHPIYKKYVNVSKKYMIHDESNTIQVGDEITIKSSRPISRKKNWVVDDTSRAAKGEQK
jgi:small subunit ribosomal protein S17